MGKPHFRVFLERNLKPSQSGELHQAFNRIKTTENLKVVAETFQTEILARYVLHFFP